MGDQAGELLSGICCGKINNNNNNKQKGGYGVKRKKRSKEQRFVIFRWQEPHPHAILIKCPHARTLNLCFPALHFQHIPLPHQRWCPVLFSPLPKLIPTLSCLLPKPALLPGPQPASCSHLQDPKVLSAQAYCAGFSTQNIPHLPISHTLCTPIQKIFCIP